MPGEYLIYVSGTFALLASLAVILRIIARRRTKAGFGADDWWVVFSLLPMYGMVLCGALMVTTGGAGRPMTTLTSSENSVFFKALYASFPIYGLAITMAKISMLLLYRGVFDTRGFRVMTLIVGGACLAWFIAEVFTTTFQCSPVRGAYDKSIPHSCINMVAIYYAFSASNMVLDFVVLSMPIRAAWKLSLPRKQKITMSGIFLLGGLTCLAAIARIASVKPSIMEDISLYIIRPYVFSTLEPAMAIICACLLTYRPLFATSSFATSAVLDIAPNDIETCSSTSDWRKWKRPTILSLTAFHSSRTDVRESSESQGDKSKLVSVSVLPAPNEKWSESQIVAQPKAYYAYNEVERARQPSIRAPERHSQAASSYGDGIPMPILFHLRDSAMDSRKMWESRR